jgi:NADH dehydrogenase [ubiquinone] 1 alpha subcomplex assembly factor 7
MGAAPFRLVELGPGRGTLMADLLRALAVVPEALAAARVHLVETSPVLVQCQRTRLGEGPTWHTSFEEVPRGPLVVIANELFDALPVHQVERTPSGFRERMVGLGPAGNLCFALAPGPTPAAALAAREHAGAAPGAVVEVSPAAIGLIDTIARRIVADGGAALAIDFAAAPGTPSLQAVRRHRHADPLADPGEADLAAAVDFALLARVAREAGAEAHGPVAQGDFLMALGIVERGRRLGQGATDAERAALEAALGRLTGAGAMGHLFQALAVIRPGQPVPAGFAGGAKP